MLILDVNMVQVIGYEGMAKKDIKILTSRERRIKFCTVAPTPLNICEA
jgi:hypothetical protein